MPRTFTRRNILAAGAMLAVAPAIPARSASGDYEVVIVGAGAAGLAAGRRIAEAGKSYVILEAADRAGGRIASANLASGAVYDRGANRFSAPSRNPLVAVARAEKLKLYEPSPGRRLYIGPREARDGEYDDFTASLRRANRTIAAVAELGRDTAASRALPELGDWRGTIAFVLGPLTAGKDLDDVSSVDLARAEDRPDDVMLREGTAALLAAAGKSLAIELGTAVQRIDMGGRGRVELATNRGTLSGRTVIVTASTNVLVSDRLRFSPGLPAAITAALSKLSLGTYERAILEMPGNPYRFGADERIIFKTDNAKTILLHTRVGGSDLLYADLAGRFGRELANAGEASVAGFLADAFAAHFGGGVKQALGKIELTRWSHEPYVQGGFSAAVPGGALSRRALMEPISDRVFLAGEAAHETLWGTVAGAALSGERRRRPSNISDRHRRKPRRSPAKGRVSRRRWPRRRLSPGRAARTAPGRCLRRGKAARMKSSAR
jgi:monoamine oxidase